MIRLDHLWAHHDPDCGTTVSVCHLHVGTVFFQSAGGDTLRRFHLLHWWWCDHSSARGDMMVIHFTRSLLQACNQGHQRLICCMSLFNHEVKPCESFSLDEHLWAKCSLQPFITSFGHQFTLLMNDLLIRPLQFWAATTGEYLCEMCYVKFSTILAVILYLFKTL